MNSGRIPAITFDSHTAGAGKSFVKISLVRRGYSPTGGAEAYLKRLGQSLNDSGFTPTLYATHEWPSAEWPYGKILHLKGGTPVHFADGVKAARDPEAILFSLERIWACDCYRAGDGLHRVWLRQRSAHESLWKTNFRFLNRKHTQILKLEDSLFRSHGARCVIANSQMVKDEIVSEFQYPADRIHVVHNGLPDTRLESKAGCRADVRLGWGLGEDEIALLFAGSGWARKGLQFAVEAVNQIADSRIRLIVAGAGKKGPFDSKYVQFLGPVKEMASTYAGADLFILPTIYDPFSNACLEAVSFGLPVITTINNGFAEIMIPGVHGTIVKSPDDVKGLVAAILSWRDPQKRAIARIACSDLAKAYPIERNVKETLAILLGGKI